MGRWESMRGKLASSLGKLGCTSVRMVNILVSASRTTPATWWSLACTAPCSPSMRASA